ncbi:hypothetical protein [Streptomyces milbemycinicus]|uniref:hypothetical protein n=1 Tax=Streptomyces milbemycinicus TaxID=476552 RepID=UPI003410B35C
MRAKTGTTRGGALFGTAAAVAVAVGGTGAVLVPVRDVALGGLWLLVGWLMLAGVAGCCAELALGRSSASIGDASDFRTLRLDTIAILATALVAELTLIAARLAHDHEYATAWASGGVLLALVAGASWRITSVSGSSSGHTPSDSLPSAVAFALAEACGGWLTTCFAVEGPLWAAWVLGCAMVVLAGGFWLSDSQSWGAESTYLKVFGSAVLLGVAGVVARFAVRGEMAAAWWVGGVAVAGPLLVVMMSALRQTGAGRGATAPPGAQLAGILVPLGSLAWAMWSGKPWSGPDSGDRLLEAGWLTVAGAVLLVTQYGVLVWTSTAPSADRASTFARVVRTTSRERSNWITDDLTWLTVLQRLMNPLESIALNAVHRRTAMATGLAVDDIWPRIELVAPDEVNRRVRRRERGVLVWRITVASAVCTTGVWLLVALTGLGGLHVERGVAVLPVVGPLAVAALALAQARRSLVEVYEAKADAVDVYRYDLAKRMHLSVPENPSGADMSRLAAELSGESAPDMYEERWRAEPGAADRARRDELAAAVAGMVSADIRAMVGQAIRDERLSAAARTPVGAALTESQLTQLAQKVARSTAGPVGARLESHLSDLQRKFHQDMRSAIRTSLTEAVTGPALTNFVGYFAIELEDSDAQDVRAEGGTIRAPAGRRLRLLVSVVRDEHMRDFPSVVASRLGSNFFVLEPVRVEGGRDAGTASFDVMADSSTLTPLPQRKNLHVEHKQQTAFGFQVPEEGNHEIWLQLYQAGHLVQVVALKIEAAGATDDV